MLERILLSSAFGLLETSNASTYGLEPRIFKVPAEFHIGMLSISLISGLAYGGYVSYRCWTEGNIFLSYIRNLMIALVCRTFFAILSDSIVVLGTSSDIEGGNALSAFECISLNLVYAYWLLLTIYLYARMQRNFNNEPNLKLYQIAVPAIAVFFSLVWIFAMEREFKFGIWWSINFFFPYIQWITASLRLLYLFIQLGLLVEMGISSMKSSYDNDTISLLRKVSILMGVLVFLFWLQFGLSVGRPERTIILEDMQPYLFGYFFIDGLLCAFVCPIFYFFDIWVVQILFKISPILSTVDSTEQTTTENDIYFNETSTKNLQTLDSVFVTRESGKQEPTKDVVYSSVVEPEKLRKTLDLYKRFNLIPSQEIVTIEGEQFYDCHSEDRPREKIPVEEVGMRTPKKNAFYTSKYLILEPKESRRKSDELRPDKHKKSPSSSISSISPTEVVEKWLKRVPSNEERKSEAPKQKSKQNQLENDNILVEGKHQPAAELKSENKENEPEEELNLELRVVEDPIPEIQHQKEPKIAEGSNHSEKPQPKPKARKVFPLSLPESNQPTSTKEQVQDQEIPQSQAKGKIVSNQTESESEFETEKRSSTSSVSSFSLNKYCENQIKVRSKFHSTS